MRPNPVTLIRVKHKAEHIPAALSSHCPPHSSDRCSCEPTPIDENFYKLVPIESPQKKPDDTCIRQFLGGTWLDKKQEWSQEGERLFGGDGYHGYERTGLELA